MKIFKHRFAIILGTALFMSIVIVVSLIGAPKAPILAYSDDKAIPIILASAQSLAPAASKATTLVSSQPETLPVPCPIWMLSEMTGWKKKTNQSADGGTRNPQLVPAGIWFMQQFGGALRKPL